MANRLEVGQAQVEYSDERYFCDEALLVLDGGLFGDSLEPVVDHGLLAENRVIRLRCTGAPQQEDVGSPRIAALAIQTALLLEDLGVERAHVCAHADGTAQALQLALDRPDLVQSLILLEPTPVDGSADLAGPLRMPLLVLAANRTAPRGFEARAWAERLVRLAPQAELAPDVAAGKALALDEPAGVSLLISSFVLRHPIAPLARAEG